MTSRFFAFNGIQSVASSDEDPFYPASNLLAHPTYKEFRGQTTEASVVFEVASTVDSFLLCGNTTTGEIQATSIKIEANFSNVWTAPAYSLEYDLTLDNQAHNLVYLELPPTSMKYWRLTLYNPTGSYAGISNCYLGLKTELAVDLGYTFTMLGRSEITKGRYGQRFVDLLPDIRQFECTMSVMNQTERDTLSTMSLACSTHSPLWMVLSPTESLFEAGYFYFESMPEFENQAYHLYNATFTLEEVV